MVCSYFDPGCLVEHPNLCGRCFFCKEHCICEKFHMWSGELDDVVPWDEGHQKIKGGLIKIFLTKWRELCQKI